ncbi:MAG TPA: hypothetical protein VHZ24_20020 [Pirellulales bacterium]|nr:hypothetical protein [Pirellulales bacterium]
MFYASTIFADELRVDRGRPYALPPHERQVLDVYSPASGQRRPVVVWIHGGGRYGDGDGQRDLSPAARVGKGRKIPPFLIFYIDHPLTKS